MLGWVGYSPELQLWLAFFLPLQGQLLCCHAVGSWRQHSQHSFFQKSMVAVIGQTLLCDITRNSWTSHDDWKGKKSFTLWWCWTQQHERHTAHCLKMPSQCTLHHMKQKSQGIINHNITLTASDLLRCNVTGWLLLRAILAVILVTAFRPPSLITTFVRAHVASVIKMMKFYLELGRLDPFLVWHQVLQD